VSTIGRPGELTIRPHAHSASIAGHMVLLAHMGKIKVPDGILLIKTDEQLAVADVNVARHWRFLNKGVRDQGSVTKMEHFSYCLAPGP
jgi:hypothetical protein